MSTAAEILTAFPEAAAELIERGRIEERERVSQHLQYGARCLDFSLAHSAIRSGEAITPATIAAYYDSMHRRTAVDYRQAESDEAGAALDGKPPPAPAAGMESAVAAEVERLMGPEPQPPQKGFSR